jgi:hypothetical protein
MQSGINDSYKKLAEAKLPGLVQLLESCMSFEKWGFLQSFYGLAEEFAPSVIYDSSQCRVRFVWLPADIRDGPDSATLNILYGRSHASNQQRLMIWNGQICHCWHNLYNTLWFLDGLSPQEAIEKSRDASPVVHQFAQRNKGHSWTHIEWGAKLEAAIWEHYGTRLFDLFDVHRPDLWEKYKQSLTEFYNLRLYFHNPSSPPRENIC